MPRCTAVSRHPHLRHGPRPPREINWEPNAGKEPNQCDKHPGFDGMPENHFNFSRANAVRPKDVGVGGLAGSTNGFTPATPLNLSKIRKSRTNWGEGPLSYQTCYYTTRLYSSAWWFLFVWGGYTSWLVSVSLLEKTLFLTEGHIYHTIFGCLAKTPSCICLSVYVGAVIRSGTDKVQFLSAEENAQQEAEAFMRRVFSGSCPDCVFFRKDRWLSLLWPRLE